MTRSRISTVLAAFAVAASAAIATSPAASALSQWSLIEDASDTITNVTTAYPTIAVEVGKSASYATPTAPVFKYEAKVVGLDAIDETCTSYLNGVKLDSEPCDWGFNGFGVDMVKSGNYEVKTATQTLASWTFTMPSATPPPAAPAKCVIKTATAKANAKGYATKIVLTTNGKCGPKDASWNYSFSAPTQNGGVSVGLGTLYANPKNPNVLIGDPEWDRVLKLPKGTELTLQYAPNGLVMNTEKFLTVK